MPVDAEIAAMETFVEVMEPFVRITEIMGSETWVTISATRPLLFKPLTLISIWLETEEANQKCSTGKAQGLL